MKTSSMKLIHMLLLAVVLCLLAAAPPVMAEKSQAGKTGPQAVYPEMKYEFAPVLEGIQVKHDFVIENRGDAPLVIQNVHPS
ncbi:MAG: hypothetical protein P8X55_19310 [Desulfosarcinaceae bacterium]|jgi:hypothetical protein